MTTINMNKTERSAAIYYAMRTLHPEYFETEDEKVKSDIMSRFHDEVFDLGLDTLCRQIMLMDELADERGEKA